MTTLTLTTLVLPAALLGADNPFPQLRPRTAADGPVATDGTLPPEYLTHLGYGIAGGIGDPCLPYTLQDDYGRARRPEAVRVAVLENELLRATILLDFGGRLWSLHHKPSARELLYVNPMLQPAHLAIRNAWFSGGVEWNCGVRGHSPHTCAPLFAAEVRHPDGWPVLRLWEFERIRAVPYQLDFLLEPGSAFLKIRVGLSNPHAETIPLYWWSNIAVPETSGTRVLAPATQAIGQGYQNGLGLVEVPVTRGSDISRPRGFTRSHDYFFLIPPERRPWIASLEGDGKGLVHASTDGLRGRKLFAWGDTPGGRSWQRFLGGAGPDYCEIQAGVARTQYESFPMAAHSRRSWIEAYGLVETDPAETQGPDWAAATARIEQDLDRRLPTDALDRELASADALADQAPVRILQHGSGWGALERIRREAAGEAPLASAGCPFPDASLTEQQAPWLALLRDGRMPDDYAPSSWMIQKEWATLLRAAPDTHWGVWLHRGLLAYQAGNMKDAEASWQKSRACRPSVWALRNLGILSGQNSRHEESRLLLQEAITLESSPSAALAREYVESLLATGCAREAWIFFQARPGLGEQGRLRVLKAKSALALGDLHTAGRLLGPDLVVADLREGEHLLNETWWDYRAQILAREKNLPPSAELRRLASAEPLPPHLDFRQVGASG